MAHRDESRKYWLVRARCRKEAAVTAAQTQRRCHVALGNTAWWVYHTKAKPTASHGLDMRTVTPNKAMEPTR